MITTVHQEHLDELSPKLRSILEKEISFYGNALLETAKGWPAERSVFIFLKEPFGQRYEIDGIEYRNINDPHWWKEEYQDEICDHTLACSFGSSR